ncbi:MAG: hypothetical protein ABJB49_06610 [Nitrospirota bacterium]
MSKGRAIRCFDYVNHPYQQVRDKLSADALLVFQAATKAATSRAQSVASELRVDLGGVTVETEIRIAVKNIEETIPGAKTDPSTCIELEWEAAKMPHLFPLMKAELSIYPLTSTETQLDFSGIYEPPLGVIGRAVDGIAGHRIVDASVHRFVSDVAAYLRQTLG